MFKDLSEKAFCDKYLKFVQLFLNRYKEDISTEQKDALMELCRVHVHAQVSYYRGINVALDGPGCQFPWSQTYQSFNTVSTSIIQSHLSTTDSSLGPRRTNLLIQSRPLSYRHLSTTDSSSVLKVPIFKQSRPLLYRYLSTTDSFLGPRGTKLHAISSTSIIETPLYYGQFSWS